MQTQLFISGSWLTAVADGTLPVIDPATEAVAHQSPAATAPDTGGYKQSGIGRELARRGLDDDLETEQITNLVSDQPWGWYLKG